MRCDGLYVVVLKSRRIEDRGQRPSRDVSAWVMLLVIGDTPVVGSYRFIDGGGFLGPGHTKICSTVIYHGRQ
jgi:hypothetical protein